MSLLEESEELLYSILRDDQWLEIDKNWEIDFSYEMRLATHPIRFRVNMFRQNRGLAAVFRLIPYQILTPEQIGLETQIQELTKLPRGLVLVTGPTGSGKTTTLATMLDMINARDTSHILTIEDPIEFVYQEKQCVISQRELSAHTKSFGAALRSALREDPDVILVGEMRDAETMKIATQAAETGHLVLSTLHTNDAKQSVDRIVNTFPPEEQLQIRLKLSVTLRGIVSQSLVKKACGKGRVCVQEVLVNTPFISELIKKGEISRIDDAIRDGSAHGMISKNQSLFEFWKKGDITEEDAVSFSNRPTDLKLAIRTAKFEEKEKAKV